MIVESILKWVGILSFIFFNRPYNRSSPFISPFPSLPTNLFVFGLCYIFSGKKKLKLPSPCESSKKQRLTLWFRLFKNPSFRQELTELKRQKLKKKIKLSIKLVSCEMQFKMIQIRKLGRGLNLFCWFDIPSNFYCWLCMNLRPKIIRIKAIVIPTRLTTKIGISIYRIWAYQSSYVLLRWSLR